MEEQPMAQDEVDLYDDMDNSPGARTIPFAYDGESYEINLSPDNADAFKAMLRPYLLKARAASVTNVLVCLPGRLNHATGALNILDDSSMNTVPVVATATGPGEYLISHSDFVTDRPVLHAAPALPPTPHLGEVPRQAATEDRQNGAVSQGSGVPDTQVREWAKRYGVPGIPARGKMPAAIREIYTAFQNDNEEPWRKLLLEHDIDPDKALADARALTLVDSKKPEPTEDEVLRKKAKNVGRLNSQQLSRLRRMLAADKGRVTTDGTSGDKASFQALDNRGCCTAVVTRKGRTTYQITEVGRLYFEVRGVSPTED
ncbi:hypothetical protein DMB38_20590 [Streptomyces sp. WAC 06738]|uniref:Lsr2 dimerization domain-containing protein n=1 Tax=Streptomyces sp. WAC 06738 TaxID=2203210 RepID=UPI000F6E8C0B|nr:histone-like nucleoid-structuring protein Lsr2 [Streptomyces sp. WAC 06738]AZM47869.1 hypothetical protein DMB38_20590 [Streptomyces sp. WAC 06738]